MDAFNFWVVFSVFYLITDFLRRKKIPPSSFRKATTSSESRTTQGLDNLGLELEENVNGTSSHRIQQTQTPDADSSKLKFYNFVHT